jgi:DNA-binding transcriptional regulator YiaG
VAALRSLGGGEAVDSAPAALLVEEIDALERELLRMGSSGKTLVLTPIRWDEYGGRVIVPRWRALVSEYAAVLHGLTVRTFPKSDAELRTLAGRVPSTTAAGQSLAGISLDVKARVARAREVLAAALGLALLDGGWSIASGPAAFHVERDGLRVSPWTLVDQLAAGLWSAEQWGNRCDALGVGVGAASAVRGQARIGDEGLTRPDVSIPESVDRAFPERTTRATLGGELRRLREAAGLTVTELATSAGMRPAYLEAIERGTEEPTAHALRRLAEHLQVVGAEAEALSRLLTAP